MLVMPRGVQAEEAGEEAVEAVEQAAQEAGKDPSRFSGLGQTGQALTSGVLSMNDTTKLGLEVCICMQRGANLCRMLTTRASVSGCPSAAMICIR